MTYEYREPDVAIVAALLDRVVGPGEDLMEAWQRLWGDEQYQALDQDLRAEIDFLFACELEEDYASAGEVKLVESQLTFIRTRPLVDTPTSAWSLWSEVASAVVNPCIRAHICDVLLTARVKTDPSHARRVLSMYLDAANDSSLSAHYAALSLARANYIARSRNMAEEAEVRAAMKRRASELGNAPETRGAMLTLLSAQSAAPRSRDFEAGERSAVRDQLLAIGDSSAALVDEVIKSLVRLAETPEDLTAAHEWHVSKHLELVDLDDQGMRKMHHAQVAADLAGTYGLRQLRDEAVLRMQSIDSASMGWQSHRVEVPLSKNALRSHLRRFRRARNWNHAIRVFLAGGPPSGSYEANIETARRGASGSIRALVSRTTYGAHGLPERAGDNFEDEEILRTEQFTIYSGAILLALELEHIRERFSPPPAEQIAGWMTSELSADPELANYFASALTLHWAGQHSNSARISIPLIEKAVRELLLKLDAPLYRTQRGESSRRFPTMDFYIDALASRNLDPDWERALRVTLLSPGINMRNLAAHGFTLNFSENDSALLLRLAGLFCAMPIEVEEVALRSPEMMARRGLRRRLKWVWI